MAAGLTVNAPFGFETEYESGWMGRYYALQSRLRSINLNPLVSLEPTPGVSSSLGAQAQYIDVKLTNAVDFGTLGAVNQVPGADPAAQDGFAKLHGEAWGFGSTAGLLLEPWPGSRVGVAYRSSIDHNVKGDARVRLDSAGVGEALGAAAGATAAKAGLETPEIISFGAYHEIDAQWAVMADASWTRWSRFRVLRVKFDGRSQADEVIEDDWRDTWFLGLGCTYRPTPEWTIRSGVGYDQSPSAGKYSPPAERRAAGGESYRRQVDRRHVVQTYGEAGADRSEAAGEPGVGQQSDRQSSRMQPHDSEGGQSGA